MLPRTVHDKPLTDTQLKRMHMTYNFQQGPQMFIWRWLRAFELKKEADWGTMWNTWTIRHNLFVAAKHEEFTYNKPLLCDASCDVCRGNMGGRPLGVGGRRMPPPPPPPQ